MNFELKNKNVENWERAEFWESDPMQQNQSICSIILYVDFESEETTVETQMNTNSTSMRVWNGLAGEFGIPEDTDFTQFVEFYKDEVQPVLKKIGNDFESEWDGSNWKGKFTEEAHDLLLEIDQILENSPKHDMGYYFSLIDSYGGMKSQIISDLKSEGIDLKTADLDNEGVLSRAVETVTWNEGSDYILLNVDVENELKELQAELQEEEDE